MGMKAECPYIHATSNHARSYCTNQNLVGAPFQVGSGGHGVRPGIRTELVESCRRGVDFCPYRKWKREHPNEDFFETVGA